MAWEFLEVWELNGEQAGEQGGGQGASRQSLLLMVSEFLGVWEPAQGLNGGQGVDWKSLL